MDPREIAELIRQEVLALPERKTEPVRAIRRRASKQLAERPGRFALTVGEWLARTPESRLVGYELIAHHRSAFQLLNRNRLESLGAGMDSWQAVDEFARILAGPAWRDGLIDIDVIRRWARSEDFWWRRAALVSTVALNVRSHGGTGDARQTLAICRMLADDQEEMVVKALSWALRELVVHDAAAVRKFLKEHGPVLAGRVKREVRNKLETGLKTPGPRHDRALSSQ